MRRRIEIATKPDQLAEVARDYFIRKLSQAKIADKLGVSQSAVSGLLQIAQERGVVFVDIDPDFADLGVEDVPTSRELRDCFLLKDGLVANGLGLNRYEEDRGDKLHTFIANTTVNERLRNWIRTGDHVVIGGGRAPVRAARMIKRTYPMQRDVRISPLSGRVWNGSWQEDGSANLERPLDSDDAARLLAMAFEHEPGTRFGYIGVPLYQDESQVKRVVEQECVFVRGGGWNTSWGIRSPDKALVGIGALDPQSGHRIPELLKNLDNRKDAETTGKTPMERAVLQCGEAIAYARHEELPCFGDVANRLFPTLYLPSQLLKRKESLHSLERKYRQLTQMLFALNKRAVVMDWVHLQEIPSVWALAGGLRKLNAIWTALIATRIEREKGSKGFVKELATDFKCATLLIRELHIYQGLSKTHRDWYADVVRRIFETDNLRQV